MPRFGGHNKDTYFHGLWKIREQTTELEFWYADLGPGYGVELVSVGPHTLKEGNKRGDWMKQWLMVQNFTALNTMCRKTPENQATYRTPKGTEKLLDFILVDRKHVYCSRDAEANDPIHMEIDHRSVMAQFVVAAPKKEVSQKRTSPRRKF